jgi:hypothetical protein
MLEFAREGLRITRANGRDLRMITTLYGPPAYMTKQRVVRGRDLDPARLDDLVAYYVDWTRFLVQEQNLPVRYVSLHNEGEDARRWTEAGLTGKASHDYNLHWPPEQVTTVLTRLDAALREARLGEVGVTPGETTTWARFFDRGYANAIVRDREALRAIDLITSHGFDFGRYRYAGVALLRRERPDLHAWETSTSWGKMNAEQIERYRHSIYEVGVNAIIPWAGLQRPGKWVGGDPNPGSAFTVREDGSYETRVGYHLYRQLSRIGQPGMAVARTSAPVCQVSALAFAARGTANPNALAVINSGPERDVVIHLRGEPSRSFRPFRTRDDSTELSQALDPLAVHTDYEGPKLRYRAPAGSVTTFVPSGT